MWASMAFLRPYIGVTQSVNKARDQLMAFLGFIKPDMQSYSNFYNHQSVIPCDFRIRLNLRFR